MSRLHGLRLRTMSLFFSFTLLALGANLAACGGTQTRESKASVLACAKATENQLVTQATQAVLATLSKDPHSVTAFLDALALDAAQAGVQDAVGFVSCVADAVKSKLQDLAAHASLDPETYRQVMDALSTWQAEHRR